MPFPIPDPTNYARLQRLPAEAAMACYLAGEFTIGEETALVDAIQRGLSLPLKKQKIEDILLECLEDEVGVSEVRERLMAAAG